MDQEGARSLWRVVLKQRFCYSLPKHPRYILDLEKFADSNKRMYDSPLQYE